MLFVYTFNPFRDGRGAPLRVRVLHKNNVKTSKIGVESGVIKVAEFNYDIQHSTKVVVHPLEFGVEWVK